MCIIFPFTELYWGTDDWGKVWECKWCVETKKLKCLRCFCLK